MASTTIFSCLLSSPIPLFLFEGSPPPLHVTLTHFALSSYEWALRLPTSFSISDLAGLGVKPRLYRSSWRALASTQSCFLLLLLGTVSLDALPLLLGICLPSLWSPLFPYHAHTLIPLSLPKVRLSLTLTLSPYDLVLWTNGSVPFPFCKGGSGVLANCSLCGTEAILCFLAGPVHSSFPLMPAILHALSWSWQHQQVCHFSSTIRLSLCPRHPVVSSIFPFTSICLWQIWQDLSFLFSSFIRLQWVFGQSFLLRNNAADELARQEALLEPSAIPCSVSPLISHIHFCLFSDWRHTVSSKFGFP